MSKFRIRMKLQGLELEIEGAREDASLISQNVGHHMTALLRPVGAIVDGEAVANGSPAPEMTTLPNDPPPAKKYRRRKLATTPDADGETASAIDFKHAPEKYGNPKQHWKTADKAIWLLYVVNEAAGIGELTARVLMETFNKHFRQAGTIATKYVSRELGRLKVKEKPSLVGEDTTKTPPTWFLTDEGRKRAQALVADALGRSA